MILLNNQDINILKQYWLILLLGLSLWSRSADKSHLFCWWLWVWTHFSEAQSWVAHHWSFQLFDSLRISYRVVMKMKTYQPGSHIRLWHKCLCLMSPQQLPHRNSSPPPGNGNRLSNFSGLFKWWRKKKPWYVLQKFSKQLPEQAPHKKALARRSWQLVLPLKREITISMTGLSVCLPTSRWQYLILAAAFGWKE